MKLDGILYHRIFGHNKWISSISGNINYKIDVSKIQNYHYHKRLFCITDVNHQYLLTINMQNKKGHYEYSISRRLDEHECINEIKKLNMKTQLIENINTTFNLLDIIRKYISEINTSNEYIDNLHTLLKQKILMEMEQNINQFTEEYVYTFCNNIFQEKILIEMQQHIQKVTKKYVDKFYNKKSQIKE